MNKDTGISARNLFFLIVSIRLGTVIVSLPVVTTGAALEDAWAAAILALLISLPVAYLLAWSISNMGKKGVAQRIREKLGTWGVAIMIPYALMFILTVSYFAAQLGTLFTTMALTGTPAGAVIVPALAVGAFMAFQGPTAIGHIAQLVFLGVVVIMVFMVAGVYWALDPARLMPHFSRGFGPVFRASLEPAAWNALAMSTVMGFTGNFTSDRKTIRRTLLLSMVVLETGFVLIVTVVIMAFGAQNAGELLSPVYHLSKLVRLQGTLERLESLVLTAWIGALCLQIGAFIYAASNWAAVATGSKRHGPYIWPVTIISAFFAQTTFFTSEATRAFVSKYVIPVPLVLSVILPALMGWYFRVREESDTQ